VHKLGNWLITSDFCDVCRVSRSRHTSEQHNMPTIGGVKPDFKTEIRQEGPRQQYTVSEQHTLPTHYQCS